MTEQGSAISAGMHFIRKRWWLVLLVSVLLIIPCFWHRHIEAGDLGSHVYNAWLAQLIEKGQAPGLYLVRQWDNVLFDFLALYASDLFGFAAGEKIVVSFCILIFFWGVFAFVGAMTGRPPWLLSPFIAMLTYGYTFNMGFFNYYFSLGFACFGLALCWRGKGIDWLVGMALAPFVLLAHPLGFLWLLGTLLYVTVRRILPYWFRPIVPATVIAALYGVRWYLWHRAKFEIDWSSPPFYFYNGSDQLLLYGDRYWLVVWLALVFGGLSFAADAFARRKDPASWKDFVLPLEFYFIVVCATAFLPDNLRPPFYAGWIGLLISRLTAISAIFALCIMGLFQPRKWHLLGCGMCAAVFFFYVYQDTRLLNQAESAAERLVSSLPPGTRIIPILNAPADWRVRFIGHIVDRACIGHCFTYSNYEAPSEQFRVRARHGSPLVTASADDAEDMEGGTYEVQETDPRLTLIYQCSNHDLTKLCIHDLSEGDTTGKVAAQQPAE